MVARRQAICIGIDEYEGEDRLDLCVADATEVADYLSQPEYGFDVELLVNREANLPNIRRALLSVMNEELEFFLLYFSGHGLVTELDAFLVTADYQPLAEGVSLADLARYTEKISQKTKHCLTILDCCHSGAGSFGGSRQLVTPEEIDRGIPARTESRSLLAACRPEQVAIEDSRYGHGLFTYMLLEGLAGDAADPHGNVTIGGLSEFIDRSLEAAGAEQIAVMKGDSAGRVILGQGFTPISADTLPEYDKRRIIAQGKQFLEDYTSQLTNHPEDWRKRGHRNASMLLPPTLRWFEKQRREHKGLRVDPEFSRLYAAVTNRVKQLAEIDLGTDVGEGVVTRSIGGGGFGTVYEVQQADGQKLAYKVYHPTEYGDSEKKSLFSRGYKAMQQLDHPRVIKVKKYTEAPLGFFMEYVDGPNFRDLPNIIEDPIEVLQFLLLTAETIAHAHSRPVIHRDIKPENILALYRPDDNTWIPYLTDFDLAWFDQATQVTKQAWGNISYSAPEQMANPRSGAAHSAQVDIYAFAQLAFYAVTGSDPVPLGRADNSRLLQEKLKVWPVGAAAQKFVAWYDRCSEASPHDRYLNFRSAMDELADVEALIRQAVSAAVTPRGALNEIAFALSGFGAAGKIDVAGGAFHSTSRRTSITLTASNVQSSAPNERFDLEARLSLDRITIEGNASSERKRAKINNRIDEVTRQLEGVKRRPGNQGTFETFISISGVECGYAGIQRARISLSYVIEAIERT
ncbi:protein kinase domain-containing protein [Streptomyces sp. N50]|uniref:protein kinase domain-containing protein n=1 Tax=Streptomyces sp. N50 TaxID=3081765 RepID=UPI0029621A86|nr:caspase family protein [Streptomyces sp. N50]WOX10599.1 caspase family protein [Streptomyces sp. N50]